MTPERKKYLREYREKNKDKIAKKSKERYLKNKDKIKEREKKYYLKNKDKIDAHNKEYNKNNRERLLKYQSEYYQKNKEKIDKKHKEYNKLHKEELNIKERKRRMLKKEQYNKNMIKYRKSHPERISINSKKSYRKLRLEVLYHYTNGTFKCSCPGCNVNYPEFLTIHHDDNNGKEHRKEIGNKNIYAWLRKNNFPSGFSVLCSNCHHCISSFGECYHNNTNINYKNKQKYIVTKRVLSHYSNGTMKCACCGENIIFFLAIDHINGGGNKHRRELKNLGDIDLKQWLINNNLPEGYRILCHNCNESLGRYHQCPHNLKNNKIDLLINSPFDFGGEHVLTIIHLSQEIKKDKEEVVISSTKNYFDIEDLLL